MHLDTRGFKATAGIEVEDIAKRLIDYGFHPPTVSFPVAGTLMVEPTESEPLEELDRFIEAMRAIREEIREIETGAAERAERTWSPARRTRWSRWRLDSWDRPYARERAGFPDPRDAEHKSWPT
jgi:glycine dehydrogenase